MNRGEGWAIIVGILMLIAFGAGGHACISWMNKGSVEQPFFQAMEADAKTNKLSQIPANCQLQKSTAVKSKSEKETYILAYVRTCKGENDAITADYLFAVCSQHYPYGSQFKNSPDKIQCRITGWIQLQ